MSVLLIAALILTSVFAFAACGDGKKSDSPKATEKAEVPASEAAYTSYKNALEKVIKLDNFHIRANSDSTTTVTEDNGTETVTKSLMNMEYCVTGINSDDFALKMIMLAENEAEGEKQTMRSEAIYTKDRMYSRQSETDKYMYLDYGPEASSQIIDSVDDEAYDSMQPVSEKIFKDAKVTDNADGSKTIECVIDKEGGSELLANEISTILDNYEDMGAEAEITKIEGKYIIVVSADGYPAKVDGDFNLEITVSVQGISASVKVDLILKIEFVDPGKPVTVNIPSEEECEAYDYSETDY